MSAPFIALTMPAAPGYDPLPVFVNAALIRTANPRRVRRPNDEGVERLVGGGYRIGPNAYEISGTFISTGDAEDQTFPVIESYGEVTGAIRDALS